MTTIQSTRFGTLDIPAADTLEFPLGLIGLGGLRYTVLDPKPGSDFFWLHSLEDPALALPVVDPRRFFSPFALDLAPEESERIGVPDPNSAQLYVTVRTAPDPADIVANLRAPLLVWEGRGHQVLNAAPGADLRVPLFAPADPPQARNPRLAGGGAPIADAA